MDKNRRVFLYGTSILLSTVRESLKRFPNLEVIQLSSPLPDTEELGVLAPDVIIFDFQASHPDPGFTLLRTLPNLTLIGVDSGSNRVSLWSGQQLRIFSTQELAQVISGSTSDSVSSLDKKE
ncbi:MAG: hypothetical protein FIA98_05295 [Anaerolineae bacterium]|nr:hypothetical protein [Anaerolineae bacterium]